ncbi:MAG: LTA synthase family protein [Gammaproteobacteria bacterium]|nr:LTA synthase family protein [Gammaproteobacteria bacterium]
MRFLFSSSRYRAALVLSLLYVLVGCGLRLTLWWHFGLAEGVGAAALASVLATGLVDDLVQLVYLLLPLAPYLLLMPARWFARPLRLAALALGSYVTIFAMLYLAAVEFFFFEEFDARFNLVAVDYLIYPHEVLGNIWESYPVMRTMIVCALASAALLALLWRHLQPAPADVTPVRARAAVFAAQVAMFLAVLAGISADSLARSDNRVANELASNGLASFFRAFRTNQLDYADNYLTGDPDRLAALLARDLGAAGGRLTAPGSEVPTRAFAARPGAPGRLNVVVVVEESFGAEFIGSYGANPSLTPEFDRLAHEGMLFTRAYATGTRTVRGLEAIVCSFPPIPSESILKRPGYEHVANWGEVMRRQGYDTAFLYGGYGYFDNMNAFFAANGFELSDRTDIDDPRFSNIWGVSDGDLFAHTLEYFDGMAARGRPFFAVIMTTSNHRPCTFPAGVPGVPEQGGGRAAGVRYADHALGEFLRGARAHAWYGDTLFVVVADHGARVYGSADIPLKSYEIPLLVLAPGHLAPAKVTVPTSQIDVGPTVLGLLGLAYEAPFFGRDVLAGDADRPLLFNHNHDVALMRGDDIVVLGLHRAAARYRYDRASESYAARDPDNDLTDLAVAYYQIAAALFKSHRYR